MEISEVNITAPKDHTVAATGVLQNGKNVLTEQQLQRLNSAIQSMKPVFIITKEEATEQEKTETNRIQDLEF